LLWQNPSSCLLTGKLDSASFALWLHTALVPSSGKHAQTWLARSLHGSPQPAAVIRLSMQPTSGKSLTTRQVMGAPIYHGSRLRSPAFRRSVNTAMRYVWLHGFGSGPDSSKGRFVRERLAEGGKRLEIPDLNQPAFRDLTVTRMLGQLDALLHDGPVALFGSSLGGYTAALWSSLRPGRVRSLILLAPAFDLAARWKQRTPPDDLRRWRERGEALVDHYAWGRKEPLSFAFLEDAASHAPFPLPDASTLVLQGTRDDVVPPDLASEFAARMKERGRDVRLTFLDDGHELTADLPRLWNEIEAHLARVGQSASRQVRAAKR
jgi:uncharacterized protein